ncbi:MAG: peptide deformylase [Pseudomonadota bacterium]
MTRPFLPWPDKRLRQVADPINAVTDETRALWDEMIEIMEAMPGYGLAAPQIGDMQRVAVVDCSDERGRVIRLANPEIVAVSEDMFTYEEASPNLPGVSAKVKRPARVTVTFLDAAGDTVKQDFEGVWATSVQHQIDHLNGRMYFDNLSRTKRDMLLKKARKP